MRRMFPFPFPIVPIVFGLIFLAIWTSGPASSTPGAAIVSPLVIVITVAIVAIIGFATIAAVTVRNHRTERRVTAQRIAQTQTMMRQQLDAVANDILKLEEEVRASGNDQARAQFRDATITYAETAGQLEAADTITELSALARRLDTAIWQLDAAEALLDGRPVPAKPQAASTTREPATQTRYRWDAARRSTTSIFDTIAAMLEVGPMTQTAPIGPARSRSRRHC